MSLEILELDGGGRGGIRTPDTLSGTPVFKTGAINHSATLPCLKFSTRQTIAQNRKIAVAFQVRR